MMNADRRATANPFDNSEFREEMKKMLGEHLKPVVDTQGEHADTLDEHERIIQRGKGIAWLIGILLTLAEALHWKKG